MATRYWVGGTGTWNGSNTANWALTSGGIGGKSAPTSFDDVYFDNNSGAGGTVTIVAGAVAGTVTFGSSNLASINLNADFTVTYGVDLAQGTISLSSYTLSCPLFISSSSNTRQIQFGTGKINLTGLTWDTGNGFGLTYTGTPTVDISYAGFSAVTITAQNSSGTETNVFNFNIKAGAYPLTIANGSSFKSLNFTGFAGSWSFLGFDIYLYGSLTLSSGMSFTAYNLNFKATSGTQTLTSAGKLLENIVIDGVGGTLQLGDNITALGSFTLTNGFLDLNNRPLTVGSFSSSNSNTRSIAFGVGNITTTGSGTAWTTSNSTNLTYTGTPTVNISNNSSTDATVTAGVTGGVETNVFNFNITVGTYLITLSSSSKFKSLNFTGFTGVWTPGTASLTFYGNLTLVSGMGFTVGLGTWSFAATSGTQVITSGGKTLMGITQDGIGGTVQLANNTTISTSAAYYLNSGTLNLNNFTLTTGLFYSPGSNTRSIAFGTGSILINFIGGGSVFSNTTTNFSYTGTGTINISMAGSIAISPGGTEANALNFNILSGSTFAATSNSVFKSLSFAGFNGSWAPGSNGLTFYGSLTLTPTMTFTTGTGSWKFSATSGTQNLTSAGKTLYQIEKIGVGGTLGLSDDLTLTNYFALTGGTFNTNNFNITANSYYDISGTNTRAVNFGSSIITLNGISPFAINNNTNLTFNAGTSTIILANSTASQTMTLTGGGGVTFYNIVIGSPSVTGQIFSLPQNCIFNSLSSTKLVAWTLQLGSSSNTTVTNWSISGSSGNLVSIVSSFSGTPATLTKLSGGTVTVDYASIKDITASPLATWFATNSIDAGGNANWAFSGPPPSVAGGKFFLLY